MQETITIPVSPDQLEVIADHLLEGKELGMVPDERVWMYKQVHRQHAGAKILSADLEVFEGTWVLKIQT